MIVTANIKSKSFVFKLMAIYQMTVSTFICFLHLYLNLIQHFLQDNETRNDVLICKVFLPLLLYYECIFGLMMAIAAECETTRRTLVLLKITTSFIFLPLHCVLIVLFIVSLKKSEDKQLPTDEYFVYALYAQAGYLSTMLIVNLIQYYLGGRKENPNSITEDN